MSDPRRFDDVSRYEGEAAVSDGAEFFRVFPSYAGALEFLRGKPFSREAWIQSHPDPYARLPVPGTIAVRGLPPDGLTLSHKTSVIANRYRPAPRDSLVMRDAVIALRKKHGNAGDRKRLFRRASAAEVAGVAEALARVQQLLEKGVGEEDLPEYDDCYRILAQGVETLLDSYGAPRQEATSDAQSLR